MVQKARLIQLNFYKKAKRQKVIWSEKPEGQFDPVRSLRTRRCWKTTQEISGETLIQKTLIISDWSLVKSTEEETDKRIKKLESMYCLGFKLFVWQKNSMEEVKSISDIKRLVKKIKPTHRSSILQSLDQYHLKYDTVKLVDYFELKRLFDAKDDLDAYQMINILDLEGFTSKQIKKILNTIEDYKIGLECGAEDIKMDLSVFLESFKNIEYLDLHKVIVDQIFSDNLKGDYLNRITGIGKYSASQLLPLIGKGALRHLKMTAECLAEASILQFLPSLKSFDIDYDGDMFAEMEGLEKLPQDCPELENLTTDISNFQPISNHVHFKKLKKLKIDNINKLEDLIAVLNAHEHLEYLDIYGSIEKDQQSPISLNEMPSVQHCKIYLIGIRNTKKLVAEFASKLPNLKSFDCTIIPDYKDAEDEGLEEIGKELSKKVLQIAFGGKKIEKVVLCSGNIIVDLDDIGSISTCTSMKEIRLTFHSVSCPMLEAILSKTPALEKLSLSFKAITGETSVKGFSGLNQLSQLDVQLSSNTYVQINGIKKDHENSQIIQNLLNAAPNIVKLNIKLDILNSKIEKIKYAGRLLERLTVSCGIGSSINLFEIGNPVRLDEVILSGAVELKVAPKKIQFLSLEDLKANNTNAVFDLSPRYLELKNTYPADIKNFDKRNVWNSVEKIKLEARRFDAPDLDWVVFREVKKLEFKDDVYKEKGAEKIKKHFPSLEKISHSNSYATIPMAFLESFVDEIIGIKKVKLNRCTVVGGLNLTSRLWDGSVQLVFDRVSFDKKVLDQLKKIERSKRINFKMIEPKEGRREIAKNQIKNTINKNIYFCIDGNTGVEDNLIRDVDQYFEPKPGANYPHPSMLRHSVSDGLKLVNGKVIFEMVQPHFADNDAVTEVPNRDISEIKSVYDEKFRNSPTEFLGRFPCYIEPGEFYVLPSLSANEKIIECGSRDPIELRYCNENNLWYVSLKENEEEREVNISFILHIDSLDYTALYREIPPLLNFIRYFVGFEDKPLENISPTSSDVEVLEAIVAQRRGKCRHRVYGALYCMNEINIPLRADFNQIHALIEVFHNGIWYTINLGGSPLNINIIPFEEQLTIDEQISDRFEEANDSIFDLNFLKTEKVDLIQKKENPFLTINKLKDVNSSLELVEHILRHSEQYDTPNFLVIYNQSRFELSFNDAFLHHSKHKHYNYYFVNDLDEMSLSDSSVNANGQCEIVTSEFVEMVQHGKKGDVLVFNWSKYKTRHVGYNAMISEMRMINDIAIQQGVVIVNILHQSKQKRVREDFNSRHHEIIDVTDCPQLAGESVITPKADAMEIDEPYSVNLYHSDEWEEPLLGNLKVNNRRYVEEPGALIEAINQKRSGIDIINPPLDSLALELFVQKIKVQRSFIYLGKQYQLPEGFQVTLSINKIVLRNHFIPSANFSDASIIYPLNSQTYYLFEMTYQHDGVNQNQRPGIIKQSSGQPIQIYYNDSLGVEKWSTLLNLTRDQRVAVSMVTGPQASFPEEIEVTFAPTVQSTPPVTLSELSQLKEATQSVSFIETNDMDYVVDWLNADNQYEVLPIARETTASDLVDTVRNVNSKDPLDFEYVVAPLLENSQPDKSKWVVLKGYFTDKLFKQLESLSFPKPYLWVNGAVYYLPPGAKIIFISDRKNPYALLTSSYAYQVSLGHKLQQLMSFCATAEIFNEFSRQLKQHPNAQTFNYTQLKTICNDLNHGLSKSIIKSFSLQSEKPTNKQQVDLSPEEFDRKRYERVIKRLKTSGYVFILGDTGFGKSLFVLNAFPDASVFVGLENEDEWSHSNNPAGNVLISDEANLEEDERFDRFEGLFERKPGILNAGEFTPTNNHYLICLGNFSNYEDRKENRFFKRHGHIVRFHDFSRLYLKERVVLPMLSRINVDDVRSHVQAIADDILNVYSNIKNRSKGLTITIRDLRLLCLGFQYFIENNIIDAAYQAQCSKDPFYEFVFLTGMPKYKLFLLQAIGYQVAYMPNKKELLDYFYGEYGVLSPTVTDAEVAGYPLIMTPTRAPILKEMKLLYQINNHLLKTKQPYNIQGILLEGPSGIGKSKIITAFLKGEGSKKIFVITPSHKEKMINIVHQAFHAGGDLFIDEIDTLDIEKEMNQFMSGYDLSGKKAETPGMMVYATRNGGAFPNRKHLSAAFLNRFVVIKLPEYPIEELPILLESKGMEREEARELSILYVDAKEADREALLTPRVLFNYADKLLKNRMTLFPTAKRPYENGAESQNGRKIAKK